MSFAINEVIEIESSQFRVTARVRNVEGERLHVAIERGGYLPWTDEPVIVRRVGEAAPAGVDARVLHAAGTTALIELIVVVATSSEGPLATARDTLTESDEDSPS